MKKQTTNQFLVFMSKPAEKCSTVVNEALALEVHQAKTFSPVDLWNIQRRSRTMMQRRHSF